MAPTARCQECNGPNPTDAHACQNCRRAWRYIAESATPDALEVWSEILRTLDGQGFDAAVTDLWLARLRPVALDEGCLLVAGFEGARGWVARRYPDVLTHASDRISDVAFVPPRAGAAHLRRRDIHEKKARTDGSQDV